MRPENPTGSAVPSKPAPQAQVPFGIGDAQQRKVEGAPPQAKPLAHDAGFWDAVDRFEFDDPSS